MRWDLQQTFAVVFSIAWCTFILTAYMLTVLQNGVFYYK